MSTTTIEERVIQYEKRFQLLFLAIKQELSIESLVDLYNEGSLTLPDDIQKKIGEIQTDHPGFAGTEQELESLTETDPEFCRLELEDLLTKYEDEISEEASRYFDESVFYDVSFCGGSDPDHIYFLLAGGCPDIRIKVYVDEETPIEVDRAELCYQLWSQYEAAPFSTEIADRLLSMIGGDDVEATVLRLKFKAWGGSSETWNAASTGC